MVIRHYTHPTINFISHETLQVYHTFSDTKDTNLQSYNYQRSVNSIDSSFSITIKAVSVNSLENVFINKLNPLDIVAIYEESPLKLDYLGVISDIAFASTSTQGGGIISISGKSIESLFNRFKISNDKTAMASFNPEASNMETKTEFLKKGNNELKPLTLNDIISMSWEKFNTAVKKNQKISSFKIGDIIRHFYTDEFWDRNAGNMEFQYPISNHLFKDSESRFIDFLKELLPEKVYECFGTIENNKPKLKIRKVPFTAKEWESLDTPKEISTEILTDYYFRRSDNEVYTSFFTYLQGSIESSEYYRALTATKEGYTSYRTSDVDANKASLYGYEPLFLTFTGFPSGFSNEEEKVKTNNTVIERFKQLNIEAQEMYSKLDEMYSGNLSIVRCKDYPIPSIGERIKFISMEFYVTEEKHVWQYEHPITISYTISRGGTYNKGKFSKGNIESILKRTIKNNS